MYLSEERSGRAGWPPAERETRSRQESARREDGLADDDENSGPGEDYVKAGPGEEELAQHH